MGIEYFVLLIVTICIVNFTIKQCFTHTNFIFLTVTLGLTGTAYSDGMKAGPVTKMSLGPINNMVVQCNQGCAAYGGYNEFFAKTAVDVTSPYGSGGQDNARFETYCICKINRETQSSQISQKGWVFPNAAKVKKGYIGFPQQAQRFLDWHNHYRVRHRSPALTWSNDIAKVAKAWAKQLASNNSCPQGSHNSAAKKLGYGENIYSSGGLWSISPLQAVSAWYDEIADYQKLEKPGYTSKVGHFTQIVWRSSTQLGCATAMCKSGKGVVAVCNYNPAGNLSYSPPKPGFWESEVCADKC